MSAPQPPPPGRNWDAVTRTIDRHRLGPLTLTMVVATGVLIGGCLLTVNAASGRDLLPLVVIGALGALITGVLAAAANAFVRPPSVRRAFEAFIYLGEWELDRVSGLAGRRTDPTVDAMRKVLESTEERPEDRWLRVELLTVRGDLHAAREMAERMPEDTPYQRVERAAALVLLDWLRGGPGDPGPIVDAVAEVLPADGDERLRAEVILGLAQVRQRVGAGSEPGVALEPLERARDRIGPLADDALLRMTRRAAPAFVRTAGGFVLLLLILDTIGVF